MDHHVESRHGSAKKRMFIMDVSDVNWKTVAEFLKKYCVKLLIVISYVRRLV